MFMYNLFDCLINCMTKSDYVNEHQWKLLKSNVPRQTIRGFYFILFIYLFIFFMQPFKSPTTALS
jgi:hypothetical protein